jgi:catechol 2,3-dioxygenase-like lactoylglutathione lyase family enzyme
MKVTEVAFTCYPVSNIPRARAFYEGVLGLTPGMMTKGETGTEWIEYEIGPHVLSIGFAPGFEPSEHGGTAALEVEDFDQAIEELREAKVRFRIEPMPTPVCRMAMVYDPDGNSVTIHKRNPGRD